MSDALNLGTWLRRLGYKRTDEPAVDYNVQPVLILGDQSSLVPRMQGPNIILGGFQAAIAAQHTVMSYRSVSPGGMMIHEVRALLLGSGVWGIVETATVWATGPTAMDTDMVGQPGAETTGQLGAILPASRQLVPTEIYPYQTAAALDLKRDIYVPNGKYFLIETIAVNQAISGWIHVTEYPAPRGS